MGAWGYGSFENDSGLDFLSLLINEKEIKKIINKKKKSDYDYDCLRITAEILIHLNKIREGCLLEQSTIDGLIDGLKIVINDEEWFKNWDDEIQANLLKRQLKKFIKQLENIEGYP